MREVVCFRVAVGLTPSMKLTEEIFEEGDVCAWRWRAGSFCGCVHGFAFGDLSRSEAYREDPLAVASEVAGEKSVRWTLCLVKWSVVWRLMVGSHLDAKRIARADEGHTQSGISSR